MKSQRIPKRSSKWDWFWEVSKHLMRFEEVYVCPCEASFVLQFNSGIQQPFRWRILMYSCWHFTRKHTGVVRSPLWLGVVPFFSWWTETQLGIFKMMSLFLSQCNWWQELLCGMEAAAWRAGWHGLFPLAVFVAWPYCRAGIDYPPLWCPAGCQSVSVFFSIPLCHRALICSTKTTCVIQPSKTVDEEPTSPSLQTQKCTFITGWQNACLQSASIHIQSLSKHSSCLVRVMWRPWMPWQTE